MSNDVFGQPDDGVRRIGIENYEPPTFECTVEGFREPYCRYADATEILYDAGIAWRFGRIARPDRENVRQNRISDANPEFIIAGQRPYPFGGEQLHRVV